MRNRPPLGTESGTGDGFMTVCGRQRRGRAPHPTLYRRSRTPFRLRFVIYVFYDLDGHIYICWLFVQLAL